MSIEKEMKVVAEGLKNDEGYFISWKANIAMAFVDQSGWDKRDWNKDEVHETANKAAEYFLNLLTREKA